MTSTVDKQLHNKNTELHNNSGENSEKVTSMTVDKEISVDEQIDEIFANHKIGYVCDTDEEATSRFKSIKSDLQSLIRKVCEEVIGEDEPRGKYNADSLLERDVIIRNGIFSEQRTKLNKIMREK